MSVLSAADHRFFQENGYVVVRDAAPQANLDATIDAIWSFLEMDRNNPEDWYHEPHRPGGMVEIYQHQALWDNRQNPRVYQAFVDIWGTERLWVSIDRACMKPPRHPAYPQYDHKGFIHWDADLSHLPVPFGVQGVLYLADTAANQGGFQCIPGMHREVIEWMELPDAERPPKPPDFSARTAVPIPGKAGDLLIWHRLLPHGNGHNTANAARFAQFISMSPARANSQEARARRVEAWQNRHTPGGKPFPGDPREWEQRNQQTAKLTPLGRKLLGLDSWDQEVDG